MPMNNPQAYAAPGAAPAPTPQVAPPVPAPPVPAPPVAGAGIPGAAPVGTLEQQVIAGFMTLTPVEKKVLLTAMDGVLGQIFIKVMPDELEEVFLEAIGTSPDQIGPGMTPPMAAGKYDQPAGPPVPPQGGPQVPPGPPVPPVSPQGPSTSLAGQQFRR